MSIGRKQITGCSAIGAASCDLWISPTFWENQSEGFPLESTALFKVGFWENQSEAFQPIAIDTSLRVGCLVEAPTHRNYVRVPACPTRISVPPNCKRSA